MTAAVNTHQRLCPPAVEEATFSISGMTCEACIARIEHAIRAVPGVTDTEVELVSARARVRFEPEAGHHDAVLQAVARAGYAIDPETISRDTSLQCSTLRTRMQRFESYLPTALTRWILRETNAARIASVERVATVMFTDIAGFTALAEGKPAGTVADFLNEHFALVTRCIEAKGGTIDKFMGDGAMAFWVASESRDHAARAARTALCIRREILRDNMQRRVRGEWVVRLRIGIHTGPVVIGSIGAPSRMNYTIIGDTVNTAQRLEQFVKEIPESTSSEVTVLIGDSTAAEIASSFQMKPVGCVHLRGRHEDIRAFVLEDRMNLVSTSVNWPSKLHAG